MLCKHYPENKSFERNYLRMQIWKKHTIQIVVVPFELQSKVPFDKETKYLSIFPSEVTSKKIYILDKDSQMAVMKECFWLKEIIM